MVLQVFLVHMQTQNNIRILYNANNILLKDGLIIVYMIYGNVKLHGGHLHS